MNIQRRLHAILTVLVLCYGLPKQPAAMAQTPEIACNYLCSYFDLGSRRSYEWMMERECRPYTCPGVPFPRPSCRFDEDWGNRVQVMCRDLRPAPPTPAPAAVTGLTAEIFEPSLPAPNLVGTTGASVVKVSFTIPTENITGFEFSIGEFSDPIAGTWLQAEDLPLGADVEIRVNKWYKTFDGAGTKNTMVYYADLFNRSGNVPRFQTYARENVEVTAWCTGPGGKSPEVSIPFVNYPLPNAQISMTVTSGATPTAQLRLRRLGSIRNAAYKYVVQRAEMRGISGHISTTEVEPGADGEGYFSDDLSQLGADVSYVTYRVRVLVTGLVTDGNLTPTNHNGMQLRWFGPASEPATHTTENGRQMEVIIQRMRGELDGQNAELRRIELEAFARNFRDAAGNPIVLAGLRDQGPSELALSLFHMSANAVPGGILDLARMRGFENESLPQVRFYAFDDVALETTFLVVQVDDLRSRLDTTNGPRLLQEGGGEPERINNIAGRQFFLFERSRTSECVRHYVSNGNGGYFSEWREGDPGLMYVNNLLTSEGEASIPRVKDRMTGTLWNQARHGTWLIPARFRFTNYFPPSLPNQKAAILDYIRVRRDAAVAAERRSNYDIPILAGRFVGFIPTGPTRAIGGMAGIIDDGAELMTAWERGDVWKIMQSGAFLFLDMTMFGRAGGVVPTVFSPTGRALVYVETSATIVGLLRPMTLTIEKIRRGETPSLAESVHLIFGVIALRNNTRMLRAPVLSTLPWSVNDADVQAMAQTFNTRFGTAYGQLVTTTGMRWDPSTEPGMRGFGTWLNRVMSRIVVDLIRRQGQAFGTVGDPISNRTGLVPIGGLVPTSAPNYLDTYDAAVRRGYAMVDMHRALLELRFWGQMARWLGVAPPPTLNVPADVVWVPQVVLTSEIGTPQVPGPIPALNP